MIFIVDFDQIYVKYFGYMLSYIKNMDLKLQCLRVDFFKK